MVPLEQDEVVIKEVRKHWFLVLSRIILSFVLAILPIIAIVCSMVFLSNNPQATDFAVTLVVLYPLWLILVWISFFFFWTMFYLDVLVVSNKRIIDINQIGLFDREVSTFPLENIQDITIDIPGAIATFLDFGDVKVHTASKQDAFVITAAAKPNSVKQIIQDEHDRVLQTLRSTQV